MNKSKKITLLSLVGVLILVCIVTFTISRYEEKKENIQNSDEIILNILYESVTSLSWEYGDESLAFHKEETWLWDDDAAFPVDEDKIAALLEPFEAFGASFRIEDVEDYSQYGLSNPEATITLTADGTDYVIQLGDYSTLDSERYVSIGDGNVYLVDQDPMEDYSLTIEDMILDDEIPDVTEATELVLEGAQNYTVVYEEGSLHTYCAEDVYFTDEKPLDTDNVTAYLKNISYLSTASYVSYNVSEEELEAYGLDTPELKLTVTYPVYAEEDEDAEPVYESVTLSIGRNQEELEAAETNEEEDTFEEVSAYFRVGESPIIYSLSYDDYQDLMAASYNDLRHDDIMTASFDDIDQLDFVLEDETYTVTSAVPEDGSEEEDEVSWVYGDEEISIAGIKSAITSLYATKFTDESPTGKEEIRLTVYLDNENYPEIELILYRYDGESCLAQLNGETLALVSRSAVVDLIEAVNAIVLGEKL